MLATAAGVHAGRGLGVERIVVGGRYGNAGRRRSARSQRSDRGSRFYAGQGSGVCLAVGDDHRRPGLGWLILIVPLALAGDRLACVGQVVGGLGRQAEVAVGGDTGAVEHLGGRACIGLGIGKVKAVCGEARRRVGRGADGDVAGGIDGPRHLHVGGGVRSHPARVVAHPHQVQNAIGDGQGTGVASA